MWRKGAPKGCHYLLSTLFLLLFGEEYQWIYAGESTSFLVISRHFDGYDGGDLVADPFQEAPYFFRGEKIGMRENCWFIYHLMIFTVFSGCAPWFFIFFCLFTFTRLIFLEIGIINDDDAHYVCALNIYLFFWCYFYDFWFRVHNQSQ